MDSDSLSFAYFLIWLNPSPTLILLPLFAENLPVSFIWTLQSHCCLSWSCWSLITPCALNVDADDYLFSLIPDYARVLARVRFVVRVAYLCRWSGNFLFSRTGSRGGFLVRLVDLSWSLLTWLHIVMTCLPRLFLPITIGLCKNLYSWESATSGF